MGGQETPRPDVLIAEARRDISDADRCVALSITPATHQLHRRLREVTDALEAATGGDHITAKHWSEVTRLRARVTQLEDALFQAYVATGGDTDGAHDFASLFNPVVSHTPAELVVAEIKRMDEDHDRDADFYEGQIEALRTKLDRLTKEHGGTDGNE